MNARICRRREERKRGHSYLQFVLLPESLAVYWIQTTPLWESCQRESTVTFLNARFLTMPYQVAGLPASSCYRHKYKRPTEKAAEASGKLLHPASWYRAFLCQRWTMAVTCWSPKAVPNPSPSCSSPQVSPTALEALVPVAIWHIQPGAPEVALTESWQATCDVTESGVTMASDLLMFIGNE